MYTKVKNWQLFLFVFIVFFTACKTDSVLPNDDINPPPNTTKLSYGDSIIYLQPSTGDFKVMPQPLGGKQGQYLAFPDGLDLNALTGEINVTNSETGMRYKVMFIPTGTTDTLTTKIVLSGISYKDFYHIQAANDSLSRPFYNANFNNFNMPCTGAGCQFDVNGSARAAGLVINPATGVINLKRTLTNGFFRVGPAQDGDKKDVYLSYKLNDASNGAINVIRIKLYFYNNQSTVDANLAQLLIDRSDVFLRVMSNTIDYNSLFRTNAAKPRPPCIIIMNS
jgi:hypothetical protein